MVELSCCSREQKRVLQQLVAGLQEEVLQVQAVSGVLLQVQQQP
jgi:hypothetical protein